MALDRTFPTGQFHDQRLGVFQGCMELILEQGPRGFTVDQLAEKSGTSASSLYRQFRSVDALLDEFWSWCWQQLNAFLAAKLFDNEPPTDAREALLAEFDHIWEARTDEFWGPLSFLCFLYYRRSAELGQSETESPDQERFENRIRRLCEHVVKEAGSSANPRTLQTMAMSWCATVLFAWQFTPEAASDITPSHARLGLADAILTTLTPNRDI